MKPEWIRAGLLTPGFIILLVIFCNGQQKQSSLLHSTPVSFTPLSIRNSDLSLSGAIENRFHNSFSVRLAADYIYSGYYGLRGNANGFRVRPEIRHYIAGHKLIESRSKVWPYIGMEYGARWLSITRGEWVNNYLDGWSYKEYITFKARNKEWHIVGKIGMQTAFGKNKRFLFDLSTSYGYSRGRVKFNLPEDAFYREEILDKYTGEWQNERRSAFSDNLHSGNFATIGFEACFGYRLGR
ncbi:MAG: hypothetical protein KIT80_23140 [Chitinophagaceae bacterium]|nr:hypothetical protein [Chitinophagaceae bacterium]MCW5929835.1 hypothetical protein [Chitinophagaceae bacterium]